MIVLGITEQYQVHYIPTLYQKYKEILVDISIEVNEFESWILSEFTKPNNGEEINTSISLSTSGKVSIICNDIEYSLNKYDENYFGVVAVVNFNNHSREVSRDKSGILISDVIKMINNKGLKSVGNYLLESGKSIIYVEDTPHNTVVNVDPIQYGLLQYSQVCYRVPWESDDKNTELPEESLLRYEGIIKYDYEE